MAENMKILEAGDRAPDFTLPGWNRKDICLKDYQGRWLVLYFYPKDNTSGCTREAADFTAGLPALSELDAEVLGISRDSPDIHHRFREKHSLKVALASDPDHKVTEAYGAWALKKMYGKESYGVVRSTFLIDPQGRITRIWRNVKVSGHVDAVLKSLSELTEKGYIKA